MTWWFIFALKIPAVAFEMFHVKRAGTKSFIVTNDREAINNLSFKLLSIVTSLTEADPTDNKLVTIFVVVTVPYGLYICGVFLTYVNRNIFISLCNGYLYWKAVTRLKVD